MSKKNRAKKKNKLKVQKKIEQFVPSLETTNDQPLEKTEVKIATEKSSSIIDEPTMKLISKDVRMIIITIIALAILLAGVKVLDAQTTYISSLGDWLYKLANISTM